MLFGTYADGIIVVSSAAYYYYNFFRRFIPRRYVRYADDEKKSIFTVAGLGSTSAEPLCVQDGQRGSVKTTRHPTHTHTHRVYNPFTVPVYNPFAVPVFGTGPLPPRVRRGGENRKHPASGHNARR